MNYKTAALAGGLAIAFGSTQANAIELGLELNLLKPANQDVVLGSDYQNGRNDILEPDTDLGFRLYAQDGSWRASWLSLRSKTSESVTGRNFDYYTAIDHPDDDYGSYDTLSASGEIELNELGVDYLIPLNVASTTQLALAAGLRYVNFESTINADFDAGGQIVDRNAENDMFGLRLGIEGSREVGPVSIEAAFGFGLLFGESDFTQTESFEGLDRKSTL